jgi:outer membrane protein, heavy metal efflux system
MYEVIGSRAAGAAVMLLLLAGCVAIPADQGRSEVDEWVRARGREVATPPEEQLGTLARESLRAPLGVEDSVRFALIHNPDVRATYARLGLGAADLYEAGRLSNPRFSVSLLNSSVSGEQLTLALVQSFTDLLLLPSRSRVGQGEFQQLKQSVAHQVLELAALAEESHYRVLGAQQIATMRDLAADAAAASAELAERFHAAGNLKQLELARERAAASSARLAALAARSELLAARTNHARVLGISSAQPWSLAGGLQMPLASEGEAEELVALAQSSRLDVAAARGRVEAMTASVSSARKERWLGDLAIGVERERETDGERLTGPTLAVDVPLFNLRSAAGLRAYGEFTESRAALARLELDVAHEVQLAHAETLAAKVRVDEYRTVLIPAREAIVQRTQEELNFMLAGQFELLAARQAEYDAYGGYLQSVRDYWIARSRLAHAVGTKLPGTAGGEPSRAIELPLPGAEPRVPRQQEPTEPEHPPHHEHRPDGGAR